MTTLDSDKIASLLVWAGDDAIDYPEEEIDGYGLSLILEIICDNYKSDAQVDLFDIDCKCIGSVTVGEIREYIAGQEA